MTKFSSYLGNDTVHKLPHLRLVVALSRNTRVRMAENSDDDCNNGLITAVTVRARTRSSSGPVQVSRTRITRINPHFPATPEACRNEQMAGSRPSDTGADSCHCKSTYSPGAAAAGFRGASDHVCVRLAINHENET